MRADGSLEEKDALVGIVVAAICADGARLRSEVTVGVHVLSALAGYRLTSTEVLTRLEWMGGMLVRMGEDAFLDLCLAALPPAQRAGALAAASAALAADGVVGPAEEAFLVRLGRRLG